MDYESFVSKVSALLSKVGGITAGFENDTDKGRYVAKCSDGTTITGNRISKRVTVRWNNNHTALADI